jgi:hypothetical protein
MSELNLKIPLEETANLAVKLKEERDEARKAFVIATDQMVIAQGKVREANKERDEARSECARLREIIADILHEPSLKIPLKP